MEKKTLLESLQKISDDCTKSIENGFSLNLNLLTIKNQVDNIISSVKGLHIDLSDDLTPPISNERAEPLKLVEEETYTSVSDITDDIESLSEEVSEIPAEDKSENQNQTIRLTLSPTTKHEEPKPLEEEVKEQTKLPVSKISAVQPLKSSSFLPEKPNGETD